MMGGNVIAADTLRSVMRSFPTGVVAVTALTDGQPIGLTVGSFFSVSLDPALVGFAVSIKSTTWPTIQSTGRFSIDILGAGQASVGAALATPGSNKFQGVEWRISKNGLPILKESVAHLECRIQALYEAGDHLIAIAAVCEAERLRQAPPLVYLAGRFHTVTPNDVISARMW